MLIDAERRGLDIAHNAERHPDASFYVSVVTASELLHGVHRADDRSIRARRSAFVEAVLADVRVLGIDLLTARTHAELWASLARDGRPIGAHDLWLAATCVGRGLTLVTANVREFARVPGLVVDVWA